MHKALEKLKIPEEELDRNHAPPDNPSPMLATLGDNPFFEEGIMAKKADSAYAHSRSRNWLKFKCARGQEFVIGGFTEPEGERPGFGALLIGYHEGGELIYAGKVGTGYDNEFLRTFRKKMDALERNTSPFARGEAPEEGVHFIRPELVAEVAFTEWTEDHRLRQPRFKGLRRDKDPDDVVREDV